MLLLNTIVLLWHALVDGSEIPEYNERDEPL